MNEESGEHGQDDAGDELEDEGVHPKGQPEKEVVSVFVTFRFVMHVVLGLVCLFVLVGPNVECEILRD